MTHEMIQDLDGSWSCPSCPHRLMIWVDDNDQVQIRNLAQGENVVHFGRVGNAPTLNITKEET